MATLAQIDLMQEGVLFGLPMPMVYKPAVPLSDEEIIAFSERNQPYQIERNANGELEIMSPLRTESGEWEAFVIMELGFWNRTRGGHVYSSNAGFTLPDTSMRSPDAAWISEARWNELSVTERRGFAFVCPQFLVEIVSESDRRGRVEAKMEMWLANGAELAWMIDPYAAEVLVYRAGAEVERLERPEWVEADSVVVGFRLETGRMWEKS